MEPTIKSIKVGSRVVVGKYGVGNGTPEPIVWLKATPNCDFISENVLDFICFDAKEPQSQSSREIRVYGNPSYELSNVLEFICSDQQEWYFKSHAEDNAPMRGYDCIRDNKSDYFSHSGFLYDFEEYEIDSIATTNYEVDGTHISSIIRLPSDADIIGDNRFPLFKKKGVRPRSTQSLLENKYGLEFTQTTAQYAPFWCMGKGTDYYIWKVKAIDRSGYLQYKAPAEGCGLRPVCTMKAERRLELIEDGTYALAPYDTNPNEICTDAELLTLLGLM